MGMNIAVSERVYMNEMLTTEMILTIIIPKRQGTTDVYVLSLDYPPPLVKP